MSLRGSGWLAAPARASTLSRVGAVWPGAWLMRWRLAAHASNAAERPSEPRAQVATSASAAPPAGPAGSAEYESFIREHQRALLNYLWRMTGDEQSAYDLTQDVFMRAWRHFDKIRGYEQPRAWLFRVATNLALTSLASQRVRQARIQTLDASGALGEEREPAASDPAWRVAERDLVRMALDGLAPQRRAALILREVYGLSCAEVARALGVSEAAARMTLSRAREQFRVRYLREQQEGHEGGKRHGA